MGQASLCGVVDLEIIAEAGTNHNGNECWGRRLIDAAAKADASSVKFQLIYPEGLYVPAYVDESGSYPNPVFERRAGEGLDYEAWERLNEYAVKAGIELTLSVFDSKGLNVAERLKHSYIKVASTDLNNLPFLREVASRGKRTIVSTGMSTLSEVEDAVRVFDRENALERLTLLHCVSVYPCSLRLARLSRIRVLKEAFGVRVGFSDHTEGELASSMAVALGATVLEKHFTIDKEAPGFDHRYALDPDGLSAFVANMRASQEACSGPVLAMSQEEAETAVRARRGLYAARDLEPGEIISREDVLIVRPSAFLSPKDLDSLIGCRVERRLQKYQAFRMEPEILPGLDGHWKNAAGYWSQEMKDKGMVE